MIGSESRPYRFCLFCKRAFLVSPPVDESLSRESLFLLLGEVPRYVYISDNLGWLYLDARITACSSGLTGWNCKAEDYWVFSIDEDV